MPICDASHGRTMKVAAPDICGRSSRRAVARPRIVLTQPGFTRLGSPPRSSTGSSRLTFPYIGSAAGRRYSPRRAVASPCPPDAAGRRCMAVATRSAVSPCSLTPKVTTQRSGMRASVLSDLVTRLMLCCLPPSHGDFAQRLYRHPDIFDHAACSRVANSLASSHRNMNFLAFAAELLHMRPIGAWAGAFGFSHHWNWLRLFSPSEHFGSGERAPLG